MVFSETCATRAAVETSIVSRSGSARGWVGVEGVRELSIAADGCTGYLRLIVKFVSAIHRFETPQYFIVVVQRPNAAVELALDEAVEGFS